MPARVADRLIDLGRSSRRGKLLQEAEHTITELTKNASRAGLPAAVKLPAFWHESTCRPRWRSLDDLDRTARKSQGGETRPNSLIAQRHNRLELAAHAGRCRASVAGYRFELQTVPHIAAVCIKMAPKDLARARRIADSRISPDAPAYRPYTLGRMAQAIAANQKGRCALG